jgi:hypothetical protein
MSQTYASQIAIVLALILPKLGVTIGDEAITTMVSGVIIAGGVLITLIRRYQAGGINIFGARTN